MRKILSFGLFLCAAAMVAPQAASAFDDPGGSCQAPPARSSSWLAANGPSELARNYGFMLLAIAMPTAVLSWGVLRVERERARSEV